MPPHWHRGAQRGLNIPSLVSPSILQHSQQHKLCFNLCPPCATAQPEQNGNPQQGLPGSCCLHLGASSQVLRNLIGVMPGTFACTQTHSERGYRRKPTIRRDGHPTHPERFSVEAVCISVGRVAVSDLMGFFHHCPLHCSESEINDRPFVSTGGIIANLISEQTSDLACKPKTHVTARLRQPPDSSQGMQPKAGDWAVTQPYPDAGCT